MFSAGDVALTQENGIGLTDENDYCCDGCCNCNDAVFDGVSCLVICEFSM